MKLNWYINEENHKTTIPADILYLGNRWNNKPKSILIIGNSTKYLSIFNNLNISTWNLETLINESKHHDSPCFDYILCYHSLSKLHLSNCKNIILFLYKILNNGGEIYFTFLSKDSYFYKNKIKTENNLYVNQKELQKILAPFYIKNIEYTKRIKPDNKPNPHFYVLATKL